MFRLVVPFAGCLCLGASGSYALGTSIVFAKDKDGLPVKLTDFVPSRAYQLQQLRKHAVETNPVDVLIVGGGATGAGCALDAASRGLKTVVVERDDFGSGTSSRSTKLVHGGVRYLEKAVFNFSYAQLKLVFEALKERKAVLDNAAHLAHALPILTPCYQWWEVPYYWAGLKAYDLVAGWSNLAMSRVMFAGEALLQFPGLAPKSQDGRKLKGGVVYYDGQFDDARMNVALATTAASAGAITLNHMECSGFIKNREGQLVGARCRDALSGEEYEVHAKVIINAAGPFSDSVRERAQPAAKQMIQASSGTHVTLPGYLTPSHLGLIVPKTKDGRVVFMLPWGGAVIAGTTDAPCPITPLPKPTEEEVTFILDAISDYVAVPIRRSDVLSAWTGIRPLAADPNASSTSNVVRDHIIVEDPDGLITVTGGKWTTYRLMAEQGVDAALRTGRLPPAQPCVTQQLPLKGAMHYTPMTFTQLLRDSPAPSTTTPGPSAPPSTPHPAAPSPDLEVARHLATSYGDHAPRVLSTAEAAGLGLQRLVPGWPVLQAEVLYCCRQEYCETVVDFVARRSRLAFLDVAACRQALPKVAQLMAREHGWSSAREQQELQSAEQFLQTFTTTLAG